MAKIVKNQQKTLKGAHFLTVLVRETGLEPARPKAYAPKAYVYTNFTTRARVTKHNGLQELF